MHYTKPPEVDRAWPSIARIRIVERAIFGPSGISKSEGLVSLVPSCPSLYLNLAKLLLCNMLYTIAIKNVRPTAF